MAEKSDKPIKTVVKLQIPAGKANPAPPVGTALGPHGVNMQEFCQKFNAETQSQSGNVIPVVITVYEDRSYDFICKTPPASELIKKAAKLKKGSSNPLAQKVAKISMAQVEEIAQTKLPDLNTTDIEAAKRSIMGTAKQMGIQVE